MNIHHDIVGVVQNYPSVFYILCFLSVSLFFALGKNWNRGLQFDNPLTPSKRKAKRNCGSRRKKYSRSKSGIHDDDEQNKSPNGTQKKGENRELILRTKTDEEKSMPPRKRTSQRPYNSENSGNGKQQQQQQQPRENLNDFRHKPRDVPAGPGPPRTVP